MQKKLHRNLQQFHSNHFLLDFFAF